MLQFSKSLGLVQESSDDALVAGMTGMQSLDRNATINQMCIRDSPKAERPSPVPWPELGQGQADRLRFCLLYTSRCV